MEPNHIWELVREGGASAVMFLGILYLAAQIKVKDKDYKELQAEFKALLVNYATLAEGLKHAIDSLRDKLSGH